jgi:NAD+ diphosphatase
MNSGPSERKCKKSLCFIFGDSQGNRVLCKPDGTLPSVEETGYFKEFLEADGMVHKHAPCDAWGLIKSGWQDSTGGCCFVNRRELPDKGDNLFGRSGIAFQMMNLHLKNKYCGACGDVMYDHEQDRARVCRSCGNIVYMTVAPAAIVAVEKDGMLLLGHNVNFPDGRYSILAGFAEPGETLEEAAAREVYEESRVRIKNIRYFGNQPWPFPNSMMFGFLADWEGGEPTPDGGELSDVRWFEPDGLPNLPPSVSISRKLIDGWLGRVRNK